MSALGFLFDRGSGYFAALLAASSTVFWLGHIDAPLLLPAALFGITAMGTAYISEALRQIERANEEQRSKTILLSELSHRTKNNFAILAAIVRLQMKAAEPPVASALEKTAKRILIMAEVYDHLALDEEGKLVNMREYLSGVCQKIASVIKDAAPIALTVESDECHLASEKAVPIAIIANELITNALKYAFPDRSAGRIEVEFRCGEDWELHVSDNGIGLREGQTPRGLGSRIISLMTQQLRGNLTLLRAASLAL